MNLDLKNIRNSVSRSYGRTSLVVQKYSPEILLGVGLVGAVIAAVMAAKATLKVEEILEQHHDDIATTKAAETEFSMTKEELLKENVTTYAKTSLKLGKLYGPALSVGVFSVYSILASHGIMNRRQVNLIAAYNLLNEGFRSYRDRVAEEFGESKDLQFKLGLQETTETVKEVNEAGETVKVKKHEYIRDTKFRSIYSRFFDESNIQFRKDRLMNKAFLLSIQNYMNDVLTIRGHVFLNEVYEALGFPHTKEGAIVGWVLRSPEQMKEEGRDGFIDFGIFDYSNGPAREFVNESNPTILLDFNVDGIVYNLI
jgi:flagellar hook-associated protein FlgK